MLSTAAPYATIRRHSHATDYGITQASCGNSGKCGKCGYTMEALSFYERVVSLLLLLILYFLS